MDNVYIFYPIPELTRNVNQLIGLAYTNNSSLLNIKNTDLNSTTLRGNSSTNILTGTLPTNLNNISNGTYVSIQVDRCEKKEKKEFNRTL